MIHPIFLYAISRKDKNFCQKGFTLIEVTVTLTLLIILAMVVVPKINGLIRTAHEGSTKAKLSSIRSSLAMYYIDNEGTYPSNLEVLMEPESKYFTRVVPLYTQEHGLSYDITYSSYMNTMADNGSWGYINTNVSQWGTVWLMCTHTNTEGRIWTTY